MAKRRNNRSGFLFITIILILLGLILYAYKDKLLVLFNTNFSQSKEYFTKKFKFDDKKTEKKDDKKSNDAINIIEKIDLLEKKEVKKNSEDANKTAEVKKEDKTSIEKKATAENDADRSNKIISDNEKAKNEKMNSQSKKIYFAKLNANENLDIVGVNRTVYYTNMPLTETLKQLLFGPTASEKSKSLITNIPDKTTLLSVSIRNNIAYVNLSKEFEYNPSGKESTIAQVKQIVYTTTEFPNIKSVQILIEDKVKTYLGGEGIIINKPISRNDFN